MTKVPQNMRKLIEQRDLLVKEMDAIKNKIAGLEMAISLLDGSGEPVERGRSRSTASVKNILLDILKEVGRNGVTPSQVVDMANRRGITLNLGSVSSTLSRFKGDGAVIRDGDRYIAKEFSQEPVKSEDNVIGHPMATGWGRQ